MREGRKGEGRKGREGEKGWRKEGDRREESKIGQSHNLGLRV